MNRPAPFVGRQTELAALLHRLAAAQEGAGGVVLVAGEPGIGKTRLVAELAARARADGWVVLAGRAYQAAGMPPYLPFSDALREYVQITPVTRLRAQLGAGAAEIALIVRELHTRLPNLPDASPVSPELERYRLFESVAGFLLAIAAGVGRRHSERVSGRRSVAAPAAAPGLLLVLDDLHWADTPSLLLLLHLARRFSGAPALIAATYRDTEVDAGGPLHDMLTALAREQPEGPVLLHGLTIEEITDFTELAAGMRPSVEVAGAIDRETGGNPLFVAELVRLLAGEGRLTQAGGWTGWRAMLPQSVRQVIGRRLDRLSAACLDALTIAAVIGREFEVPVLERAGDLRGDALLEALEEAEAAHVIAAMSSAPGRYGFTHPLMRETLYEQLLTIRRARLHRRVGEALEGFRGTDAEPYLAELAQHFLQAAPGGDVEKAIAYARRAGDHSLAIFAYEDAVRQYGAALETLVLLPGGTAPQRCTLLLALGEAQTRAGATTAAKESFRRAAELARAQGMAAALARAALGYGGYRGTPGVVDGFLIELLDEAATALAGVVSGLRARVLARLAMELYTANERDRRDALSQQAVAIARAAGDQAALAAALVGRHYALHEPENLADRLAAATELVQLAEAGNDREVALQGYYLQVIDLLELGDRAGVEAAIAAHGEAAAALRQPLYLWRTELLLAMQAIVQGRFAAGGELAQSAYRIAEAAQIANAFPAYGTQILGLRLEAGGLEEIEAATLQLIARFPAVAAYRAGRLLALSRLNRDAEARAEFDDLAKDGFGDLPRNDDWLTTVSCLAEVAAYLDDSERGGMLYELLLPYADRTVVVNAAVLCLGAVAYYLGRLATTLGRWDAAEQHFEAALSMHARLDARPWLARSQSACAAMLLKRGTRADRERAWLLFDEALTSARELGMVYLVESISTFEARAGASARPPARGRDAEPTGPAFPAGLTAREVEVLRLVAGGRTNREIAANLVLSVRTVDHHVAAIYAKIGAHGRADAAAFALQNGLAQQPNQTPQ